MSKSMTIWINRLCIFWLTAIVGIYAAYWTDWIPYWEAGAYAGTVLIASGLAFLAQGLDKLQARGFRRRIPEIWLHLLELIGGWPGANFGQQLFRHKTFKPAYRRMFVGAIIIHITLLCLCLFYFGTTTPETAP
ncbi:DUF1294 domain-containing protein [Rubinisphaera margarita]|uniref:DUF1294 domain-containing protein n=1 Tax=Rubinisphaera margarita TaxID=2909586 RepID=UPI001EE90099|nr:DUF1294 domain-containing protein [Rubinisphaera margarita]MCG6155996.1 DUF1294 domain-containing protein [Rubinisphaera margarita]